MIDIHSHILPLVDDGSKSVDMSLEMLDQAYRDGTEENILPMHMVLIILEKRLKIFLKSLEI